MAFLSFLPHSTEPESRAIDFDWPPPAAPASGEPAHLTLVLMAFILWSLGCLIWHQLTKQKFKSQCGVVVYNIAAFSYNRETPTQNTDVVFQCQTLHIADILDLVSGI